MDFKADGISATISSIERMDMNTMTRRLSEEEEEEENPDSLASQVKELRRKAEEKKRSDSFNKFIRNRDDRRGLVLTTTVLDFDTRDVNVIKLKNATTPRPKRKGTTHSDDDSSWGAGSIDLSERVGGMNKQINEIFRRVFASKRSTSGCCDEIKDKAHKRNAFVRSSGYVEPCVRARSAS